MTIDLVINNAGTGWLTAIVEPTKQLLMGSVEVNAVGPFFVTRALQFNLQLPVAATRSCIRCANLGSTTGITDENAVFFKGQYAYSMSKEALNMITHSLAVGLREGNVAVATVHPGYVDTDSIICSCAHLLVSKVTIKDTDKFFECDAR
ncbi:hypothetical protein DVH05_002612 [Phytophthora capsici]|nr:hypothetical protein DVH05_002612 [Phytophthora capsici]